jgi:enoyl-[acyl-carrier-protein] reductase (NADH)
LWQLAQLVDPFNDWCGLDSAPGEICAEAAGSRANKHANTRNAQPQKTLEGVKVSFATALVRSCSMNSVLPRTKSPRDIDRTSVTSDNCFAV